MITGILNLADHKLTCPKCGLSSSGQVFLLHEELIGMMKLAAKFGRNWPWVREYLDAFRSSPDRPLKPSRMKIILEEIWEMVEKRGFPYDRQEHAIRPDALFAACRQVAMLNKTGFKNHNYMKKIAINFNLKLIQREEGEQRQREEEAMRRGFTGPEQLKKIMGRL
jgi:hypothetical protein